jgi:DNA-directed RNA polymerase specialized sigma24 family protein
LTTSNEHRYYRRVAQSVGVPEFWLDDAVQDIVLDLWRRKRRDSPYAVRLSAIDAARRYGPYGRWGSLRPLHVPLDDAGDVVSPDHVGSATRHELRDAVVRAVRGMTRLEREAFQRRLDRHPMSNADSLRASAARRKLRVEIDRLQQAS